MIRTAVAAAILATQVAAQPPTVFKSGIEIVELDVSVMRGGQPVQGLMARDFALTDNGVGQEIRWAGDPKRDARPVAAERHAGPRHER
jgi:hypothetical protein